jgi:hypothetical protein
MKHPGIAVHSRTPPLLNAHIYIEIIYYILTNKYNNNEYDRPFLNQTFIYFLHSISDIDIIYDGTMQTRRGIRCGLCVASLSSCWLMPSPGSSPNP